MPQVVQLSSPTVTVVNLPPAAFSSTSPAIKPMTTSSPSAITIRISIPGSSSIVSSSKTIPSKTDVFSSTTATSQTTMTLPGQDQPTNSSLTLVSSPPSGPLAGVGGPPGLVGIVVAFLSLALFAALLAVYLYRRRRRDSSSGKEESNFDKMTTTTHDGGASNIHWPWDRKHTSTTECKSYPEIVVMDARPANGSVVSLAQPISAPRSPKTQHPRSSMPPPYLFTSPYTPPAELERSARADDDGDLSTYVNSDQYGAYQVVPARTTNSVSAAAPPSHRTSLVGPVYPPARQHPRSNLNLSKPSIPPPSRRSDPVKNQRQQGKRSSRRVAPYDSRTAIAEVTESEMDDEEEESFVMETDLTDTEEGRRLSIHAAKSKKRGRRAQDWDNQSRYDGDSEVDPDH